MQDYSETLQKCRLFAGVGPGDLKTMLNCLCAGQKAFRKNAFILRLGDKADSVGIVLSGAVHIIREDFWGRRKIVSRIETGGIFGEAFACAGTEKLPVGVTAGEKAEVMFIDIKRLVNPCSTPCVFHTKLIGNLAVILAGKNLTLLQKLEHITQPTTREKLLSYLSEQAGLARKNTFDIPFNREELADYLSVERSAMSAELSQMQTDGLLLYRKNHFELLRNANSHVLSILATAKMDTG